MSDRARVVSYVMPPQGAVWKWTDLGRSVAWKTDETIAFRQELHAIVDRLAPGGLPPLSAILLLLAATRDNWSSTCGQLIQHARDLSLPGGGDATTAGGVILRAIGHRLESSATDLVTGLDRIAALPKALRHSLSAKALLAEVVFEKAERTIKPDTAQEIAAELQTGIDPDIFDLGRPRRTALRDLVDAIDSLHKGLAELDAQRLTLRLKTGLDELVQAPWEDLGPAKRVQRLLADLADDPELGGLSRLARNLLAAVHVPRLLHRYERLPVGGVSDLTNRGQLDRLLLSELAHDDLTLAVRVAMNEAIYLQRESPPREPPHRRVLLIDTGIRMWGAPRIYATAVALALAAKGDAKGELACFRPANQSVVPVDLTTRHGLLAHLEALETRPHFGAALPALLSEASSAAALSETFLITHEDALCDPEFRAALKKLDRFSGYAATVGRDGAFRLWTITAAGLSMLRQATLDLNELLAPAGKPSIRRPPPMVDQAVDLPVILSVSPFPLLLPPGSRPRRIISNQFGDRFAITNDRQLLSYRAPDIGPRLLSDSLPPGRLDLFAVAGGGHSIVALITSFSPGGKVRCVLCVDLHVAHGSPIELSGIDESPRGAALRGEIVFVMGKRTAHAFSFHSAEPIASLDISGYQWIRGRLFRSARGHGLLSLEGSNLTIEQIPEQLSGASTVVEINEVDGPLSMAPDGEIRTIAPTPRIVRQGIRGTLTFKGVSMDGSTIVAESVETHPRFYCLRFANESKWTSKYSRLPSLFDGTGLHAWPARGLRTRCQAIYVASNGRLALRIDARRGTEIRIEGAQLRLAEAPLPSSHDPNGIISFGRAFSPPGVGYKLRMARWNDNSKAFFDSRGLLHLKSSNSQIPQITLALVNNGPLAGWSSDGRVYGPKFFHGSPTSRGAQELDDLIRRFTEHLR